MDVLSDEELKEFKHWLFQENMRISAEQRELKMQKERLKKDNMFFDKKMQILQDGFRQLDIDRKKLEKEWTRLRREKDFFEEDISLGTVGSKEVVRQLFCGVTNPLTLKKRYRDLIKIYHPDNLAGDHEMVLMINKEYEQMKEEFERQMG